MINPIKIFTYNNVNAPQITNAYGSMLRVLDACLINGIALPLISSVTASGKIVTVSFVAVHKLMQYQTILIVGAVEDIFNGEHQIKEITSTTVIKFELTDVASVSTATGSISASLPSLGWEKSFSSTNATAGGKAAYRSTNVLLASRPYLRVVDERDPLYGAAYAKYAKVGIVEDMVDIDTMSGVQAPFDPSLPNKNWDATGSGSAVVNGWARWYYGTSYGFRSIDGDQYGASSNNMMWTIIGNKDWFYIINSANEQEDYSAVYGFGSFESFLEGDSSNNFLISSLSYNAANSNFYRLENNPVPVLSKKSLILQRDFLQSNYGLASLISLGINSTAITSGTSIIGNAVSVGYALMPAYIYESNVRGVLPSIKWLYQANPFIDKQCFIQGSEVFMAKNLAQPNNGAYVQIVFKIGDIN
jgi:hypothetical protein